jgi:hypothetical protein
MAKLEYERAVGSLLPRDQVLQAERHKNTHLRALLRGMPRSLAPMLAQLTAPADVERVLLQEIDLMLSRLAGDPFGLRDAPPQAAPDLPVVDPPPPTGSEPLLEGAAA